MEVARPVRREQVADLADLLGQVFGLHEYYPRERVLADLASARSRRASLVISEEGRPVSHIRTAYDEVCVYGCCFKVASIGGVATHPDYRGRGHATAILNQSMGQMVRAGAKVLIVSGNRGLYRRAHCVPAGRVYEGEVRLEEVKGQRGGIAVRRVTYDQWPLLAALHQAEPVRFLRAAEFLRQRPFWWDCHHLEIWLIESSSACPERSRREPMAYVVLAREGMHQPRTKKLIAWEHAGSRAALLEGLPALFEASGLEAIRLRVLGHDREFLHLLGRHGIAVKPSPLWGTHRLLDLPGLMQRLRPYLAARLPRRELRRLCFHQQGESCVFTCGSESVELSLSQATAVVLGGPSARELSGALGKTFSTIFPVPFPMPGFNYV